MTSTLMVPVDDPVPGGCVGGVGVGEGAGVLGVGAGDGAAGTAQPPSNIATIVKTVINTIPVFIFIPPSTTLVACL